MEYISYCVSNNLITKLSYYIVDTFNFNVIINKYGLGISKIQMPILDVNQTWDFNY